MVLAVAEVVVAGLDVPVGAAVGGTHVLELGQDESLAGHGERSLVDWEAGVLLLVEPDIQNWQGKADLVAVGMVAVAADIRTGELQVSVARTGCMDELVAECEEEEEECTGPQMDSPVAGLEPGQANDCELVLAAAGVPEMCWCVGFAVAAAAVDTGLAWTRQYEMAAAGPVVSVAAAVDRIALPPAEVGLLQQDSFLQKRPANRPQPKLGQEQVDSADLHQRHQEGQRY